MDKPDPTELPPSSPRGDGTLAPHGDLLEIILDSLTHPFYVIDVGDHHVRLANLAARQAHRSGAATCYRLTHGRDTPCDTPDHPCPVNVVKETGQPAVVEHIHRDEHGAPRNIEVHAFPMFDDTGRVTHVIEYCVDVTDRKKAEQQIRELNEDLERRVLARTAELTQANEQLREEIARRRRLEQDILDISEKEQRRIGRELHDSLGQQLTGIAIISKVLEQKLQRQSLPEAANAREIAQLVNEAISQTRQLSRGLHPVSLEADGLMSALEALAAMTENLSSVRCEFQCRQPVLIKDPSAAVHLYRIAQEAVTNAVRHSGGGQIRLELSADGSGDAALVVENDGRDFPDELPKNKGIGLQVMSYRAEMIGGALDVRARRDGGTTVTCTFKTDSAPDQKEKPHGPEDAC
jgi:signal transduction histidine kinase